MSVQKSLNVLKTHLFFFFFKIKAVLLVWPKVERQGYRPVKVTCVCRHLVASSENEIDALQCIAMRTCD